MSRLGAAGVSVPGLGIGSSGSKPVLPPPTPARGGGERSPPPQSGGGGGGSVSELQSRFAKFGVGGGGGGGSGTQQNGGATSSPPPSQGTTWAQKQAALRTVSDFRKDPSSVSLADARSAASTANNFRERHGEQVAAGARAANRIDQKYGVAGKVGGYLGSGKTGANEGGASSSSPGVQSHLNTIGAAAGMLGKKKPPPPPPPKKKPGLSGADRPRDDDAPPPIPMATRPAF